MISNQPSFINVHLAHHFFCRSGDLGRKITLTVLNRTLHVLGFRGLRPIDHVRARPSGFALPDHHLIHEFWREVLPLVTARESWLCQEYWREVSLAPILMSRFGPASWIRGYGPFLERRLVELFWEVLSLDFALAWGLDILVGLPENIKFGSDLCLERE